jgi:hypothetical protein
MLRVSSCGCVLVKVLHRDYEPLDSDEHTGMTLMPQEKSEKTTMKKSDGEDEEI